MDNYFEGTLSVHKNSTSILGLRLMFEEEFEKEVAGISIVKERNLNIHGAFIDSNFEVFMMESGSHKKVIKSYPVRDKINEYPAIELKKIINFPELIEAIKTAA